MQRGLLIGRFQPPHLGHLKIIEVILEECDELVIVVAAAQSSYSIKNPFTAGERLLMLRSMLQNNNIDLTNIWMIPVQDVYDNDIWVHHVLRMIPPVDIIYGNNPFIKLLWKRFGYEIKPTELFDRKLYEASQIRKNLAKKVSVSGMVDPTVETILSDIGAIARMQALYGSDSENTDDVNSNIQR